MATQTVEALQVSAIVELIDDEQTFFDLGPAWNALLRESRSDCLFLTHEWLSTWWKHLASDFSLAIRTVRIDGELVGIAPLVLHPAKPLEGRLLPTLEYLGNGFVGSDYLDIIARNGYEHSVIDALVAHLDGATPSLRLSNVIRDSLTSQLIQELSNHGWKSDEIEINVCPYISLAGQTWDTYLSSLGSETRYNFNRKLKRLNRDFDVRFEPACAENLIEALDTLIAQHNARWADRGGSDAFHLPELLQFHREITRLALDRGWLRLYALNLNGATAASLYGFHYREKFYFYQSGLDTSFEKYSVGFLTMGLAIRCALALGVYEYDLLHGAEPYKFHWTDLTRPLLRYEIYPRGISGGAARGCLQLGRISRNLASRVLSSTRSDPQVG